MADDENEARGPLPVIDNTPGRRYVLAEENIGDLVPMVWQFKTEWMEFVGPDGLDEWEEAMRTKVGIPFNARAAVKGCATTSGSTGGWDDCDYWGNGC